MGQYVVMKISLLICKSVYMEKCIQQNRVYRVSKREWAIQHNRCTSFEVNDCISLKDCSFVKYEVVSWRAWIP